MTESRANGDRPDNRDERYETLKSLSRLLQYDMETELLKRRVPLPVIDVNTSNSTSKKKRRRTSTSVNDYAKQLKSVRRQMIQRLLPSIKDNGSNTNTGESKPQTATPDKVSAAPTPSVSTESTPENINIQNGLDKEEDNIADSIENLRERLAHLEALKSVRRSYHTDDFQQYLGARYLQVYRTRSRSLRLRRSKTSLEPVPDLDENNEVHSTPRSESNSRANINSDDMSFLRTGSISACEPFPSITPCGARAICSRDSARKDVSRTSSRAFLEFSEMQYEFSKPNATSGVPRHAAKRANLRYFHAHGLSKILKKLRNETKSTQKSKHD